MGQSGEQTNALHNDISKDANAILVLRESPLSVGLKTSKARLYILLIGMMTSLWKGSGLR